MPKASEINVVGDYVYHCYVDVLYDQGDQTFYRTTIDGKETVAMSEYTAIGICYADGYIYFQAAYSDFDLYRIPVEGGKIELVKKTPFQIDE